MGLPQYDLVSLVRDSYVQLDSEVCDELIKYYFDISLESGVHNFSYDEFYYYFDLMAFQRNIKAVGTFGYQVSMMNNRRYEKNIAPSLLYIKDYVARRSEFEEAWKIITGLLHNQYSSS
jgi:aminoglycoside/choline kinase family phosphotransferase